MALLYIHAVVIYDNKMSITALCVVVDSVHVHDGSLSLSLSLSLWLNGNGWYEHAWHVDRVRACVSRTRENGLPFPTWPRVAMICVVTIGTGVPCWCWTISCTSPICLCRCRRSSHLCTRATPLQCTVREKKYQLKISFYFSFNFILKKNGNGPIKP